MSPKVAMIDVLTEEFRRRWQEDLRGLPAEVTFVEDSSEQSLAAAVSGAVVLITRNRPVDRSVLALAGSALRAVVKLGRWPLGVDCEACAARGIQVETIPLSDCITVAEHAMALLLACARDLIRAHRGVVQGDYRKYGLSPQRTTERSFAFKWLPVEPTEVYGKTLGIVGYGEIGREVSQRARAFGMKVLYHDVCPLPRDWEQRFGVEFRRLEELLRQADFVSLHVPHTPQTEKLIGEQELKLMKSTAYLINTCRGGVVDEEALVEALSRGDIAGAGLDVFVKEPLPHDHPLTKLENVILTCHIGGGSGSGRQATAAAVRAALDRWL